MFIKALISASYEKRDKKTIVKFLLHGTKHSLIQRLSSFFILVILFVRAIDSVCWVLDGVKSYLFLGGLR